MSVALRNLIDESDADDYLRKLAWSSEPHVEMVQILAFLLRRPITVLRIGFPQRDSPPELTTPTLAVCEDFTEWDPAGLNPAHILLLHHRRHFTPLVLPAAMQGTVPLLNPQQLRLFRALLLFDEYATSPDRLVGKYHYTEEPEMLALVTVSRLMHGMECRVRIFAVCEAKVANIRDTIAVCGALVGLCAHNPQVRDLQTIKTPGMDPSPSSVRAYLNLQSLLTCANPRLVPVDPYAYVNLSRYGVEF